MATVIFDFDSTIINCESLEVLLAQQLANQPEKMAEIRKLTQLSMNGELSFGESLQQRLAIAAPTLTDIQAFTDNLDQYWTTGIKACIQMLQQQGISVWIISGGIQDLILPFAQALNVPEAQVHAAKLKWDEKGRFISIDHDEPFCTSKLGGAQHIAHLWQHPSIAIGDGFTDLELYQHGLVDQFIGYVEHAKRPNIAASGAPLASNTSELTTLLQQALNS